VQLIVINFFIAEQH